MTTKPKTAKPKTAKPKTSAPTPAEIDAALARIARDVLHFDTLATSNSGRDFREVASWSVLAALRAAYAAGAAGGVAPTTYDFADPR